MGDVCCLVNWSSFVEKHGYRVCCNDLYIKMWVMDETVNWIYLWKMFNYWKICSDGFFSLLSLFLKAGDAVALWCHEASLSAILSEVNFFDHTWPSQTKKIIELYTTFPIWRVFHQRSVAPFQSRWANSETTMGKNVSQGCLWMIYSTVQWLHTEFHLFMHTLLFIIINLV